MFWIVIASVVYFVCEVFICVEGKFEVNMRESAMPSVVSI